MKISALHIYPVKSLGGIAVDEAILTTKGFQYDRNWMLLDENGIFMTQRTFPEMTFFSTKIENGELIFSHKKNNESAAIPILTQYGETLQTEVWGSSCEVQKVGSAIDEYFSKNLGVKCHLVFFPQKTKSGEDNIRTKPTEQGVEKRIAMFADKSALLIANEASLAELNGRLEDPLPMDRFRANIVVSGDVAYEEDRWQQIKVSNTVCEAVELCGRCALTTVDQATAEKGLEPLKTLATYRKMDREIKFGVRFNCTVPPHEKPVVRVGDEIILIA